MKAFHFRLQTKLDLCRSQEQAAKERLAACMASLDRLEAEQEKVRRRMAAIEEDIRCSNQENKFDQKMLINKEYLLVLNEKEKHLSEKIVEAARQVDEAREALLEKKKETDVLEKLRDKKWDEYVHEVQLEEQKNNDETALISYFRHHQL